MRGSSSRRWERSCLSSTYWSNPPPGHDPVGRFPVDGDRGQHLVQPQDESRGAVGTAGDLDTPFQPVEPVQPVRSARPIRSPSSVANSPPVDQPVAGLRSPSTVTVAKFSAPGWRRCPKHLGGAVVGPVVDAEGHSPGPPNRPSALPPVWGRRRRLPFARCTKSRSKTGRYFRFPLGAKDFDPGGWGALPDRRCTVGLLSRLRVARLHCACDHDREFGLDSQPVPGETGLCSGRRSPCRGYVLRDSRYGRREPRDRTLFAEPAAT